MVLKNQTVDALREKIKLVRGKIITESLVSNTKNIIRDFYVEKGFLNVEINIKQEEDSQSKKHVLLVINIQKGEKGENFRNYFLWKHYFQRQKTKTITKRN